MLAVLLCLDLQSCTKDGNQYCLDFCNKFCFHHLMLNIFLLLQSLTVNQQTLFHCQPHCSTQSRYLILLKFIITQCLTQIRKPVSADDVTDVTNKEYNREAHTHASIVSCKLLEQMFLSFFTYCCSDYTLHVDAKLLEQHAAADTVDTAHVVTTKGVATHIDLH